jgi:DNA-binding transcriptional LysR family regulator
MLTSFREEHPGVIIELMLSNMTDDLSRREADIAVRMTPPTQSALVARKVGEVALGFYATAEYLERHGSPTRSTPSPPSSTASPAAELSRWRSGPGR